MFDTATRFFGTCSVSCHGTLNPGSSKHGNARRAKIDSNWLKTYQSSPSRCRKRPWVSLRSTRPLYSSVTTQAPGREISLKVKRTKSRARHGRAWPESLFAPFGATGDAVFTVELLGVQPDGVRLPLQRNLESPSFPLNVSCEGSIQSSAA